MLCPICLGRGWATEEEIKEYPLRCEECHGKGKVSIDWHSYKCGVCDGTGKKELTNQLYIQNCTTKELIEEILAWWFNGANTYSEFGLYSHEIEEAKTRIEKWLGEKHDD